MKEDTSMDLVAAMEMDMGMIIMIINMKDIITDTLFQVR